ncbi:unnamed protein product [Blumeria hordei]|uniref:Inositol hexakisphosphate and diphosphoinositol-pentakisphosphate kinase n=1 Tax=Blumeria hordei TaxID=2867405 RepID=A0A383ULN3_BLUHO|nr:unnamed protein product [Blumeria hordei]
MSPIMLVEDTEQPNSSDIDLRSKPSTHDLEINYCKPASSIYSINSSRAQGSTTSISGSENAPPRNTSGSLGSPRGVFALPETATSNISVTATSFNQGSSQQSTRTSHFTSQELIPKPAQDVKRNTSVRIESVRQHGPGRSKRRLSGSTGASTHSSSNDRESHSKTLNTDDKATVIGKIGICALDVKARSKPSRNILNRLISKGEFEVVVFGDKVILDEDIENWPVCDFLISFYSDGFPLDKAIAYVNARKPFCVNDLPMQKILWDRRICLMILDKINVPTPKRVEVNRDGGPNILTPEMAKHLKETTSVVLDGPEDGTGGHAIAPQKVELIDDGDTLNVDGVLLRKPFVEKPINGEDHNICIYFPKNQGGGARKLFRKIGNKSSEWVEGLTVPRAILEPNSSYIYEKFMLVDNSEDVKAYTVGPTFCHAETRKSPVVDGLVRRNTHGKEIRYITSLSKEESTMASRIAVSFGQRVCGFDLLRAEGKSFVIDVNGWSFVKENHEYYDQCARILREMFIREKQRKVVHLSDTALHSSQIEQSKIISIRRNTSSSFKENHRSALHQLLHKSPTISSTQLSNKKAAAVSSPDISCSSTPITSPSDEPENNLELAPIPEIPMLPPPITSNFSMCTSPIVSPPPVNGNSSSNDVLPPAPKHTWKLKGMVSVIRHADRTPKQKSKFTFHTKPFIELLKGHQEEVLLTGEAALESVMVAVETALKEGIEDSEKLKNLRNVLVKKGGWIGTKVQIKPMFRMKPDFVPEMPALTSRAEALHSASTDSLDHKLSTDLDENSESGPLKHKDSLSGITLSRITAVENSLVLDKLQLIVKWGGEPTHSARYQSQELGESMRNDLILMNREVLDEIHVFSSSERRVKTSAQIWAAAFTDQKEIPSDFITIRKDLLDDSNAAKDEMDKVKKKLKTLLRRGISAPPQFAWPPNMPEPSIVQRCVVQLMKFHRKVMYYNLKRLRDDDILSPTCTTVLIDKDKQKDKISASSTIVNSTTQSTTMCSVQSRWCCGEGATLFKERWEKLFSEFCDGDKVDPSKISELYDTMKFDALHNRQFLEWVFTPSKSLLEEEENAILEEFRSIGKEKQQPRSNEEISDEHDLSTEKAEISWSLHRRMFRRKSFISSGKVSEESPEQYFRLFTGSSQNKAKTDVRLEKLRELYKLAKVLFDFICPQEYGMTDTEKLEIGLLTSLPLLKEIVQDLEEMQASDDAKSFIYFTKESHIYTLLNCILEGGITTKISRCAIPELDYLSQICFELYESENKTPKGNEDAAKYAYSIRIAISPGCHTFDPLDVRLDSKHCISCAPRQSLTAHKDWKEVIDTLRAKFHQVKLPKSFLAVNLSESHTFHKRDTHQGNQESSKHKVFDFGSDSETSNEVTQLAEPSNTNHNHEENLNGIITN